MKHFITASILKNKQIAHGHFDLLLEAPEIAKEGQPGQFIQIKINDGLNPLLPRPMGLSKIDQQNSQVEVLYKIFGQGTQELSRKKKGDTVSIIGPLGNSFWVEDGVKKIALVAGGTGTGPLLFYSQHLKKRFPMIPVYAFLGARSKNLLCGQTILKQVCTKVFIATNDGTAGHHGFVTDILEKICKKEGIDQIIAVGPTPMMQKAVAIGKNLGIKSQVSLEERMACGFGICLGCAVKLTDDKYHIMCVDGPIFDGSVVAWN